MSKGDFNEILKKGLVALIIRSVGFLCGYLFIFFTVKYFGADVQGRLSLSFSFMIIASLFARAGMDVNFVKIFAITDNFQNAKGIYFKILPLVAFVSLLLSLLMYFLSNIIGEYIFKDIELSPYLKWTSPCVFLFTFVLLNAGVFRGMRMNALYAFLFNGGRFLFALIFFIALFLLGEQNSLVPIKAHTAAIFLLFLISVFFIVKSLFPIQKQTTYKVKSFVLDSLPMFLSASLVVLLGWADTIILGIYKDSKDVGMYNVILKIAAVISFTMQAIDSILAPKLSRAYHDNNLKLFKDLVKFSVVLNAVVSTITIVAIFIFKNEILGIFGNEFLLVANALMVLCIGQLVNSFFGPVGSILQMTGHQKMYQNILFLTFIVNIAFNISLAPKYGIEGVALATAFSLILSRVLCALHIKKTIWIAT